MDPTFDPPPSRPPWRALLPGLAIAGTGVVLAVVLASGGDDPTVPPEVTTRRDLPTLAAEAVRAGCAPVQTYPDELDPNTAHALPPEKVRYGTSPPTSGNHYGVQPFTGVLSGTNPPGVWMHNLEHGHIGVLYGEGLDDDVRAALEEVVREHETLMFMQRTPDLPEVLDLVVWTRVGRCATPTTPEAVAAFARAFYDTYSGEAPEGALPGSPTGD